MQHQPMVPERPQKSFLLLLLATSVAWTVPFACIYFAFPVVPIVGAATLTSGVVFGLILLTSWAGKRGYDLSFLAPLLLPCVAVVLVLVLIELFFPQWKASTPLCNGFTALVSCGYIVYFSSYLMLPSSFEDDVWLAIPLFLYTVSLFFSLFNLIFGLA